MRWYVGVASGWRTAAAYEGYNAECQLNSRDTTKQFLSVSSKKWIGKRTVVHVTNVQSSNIMISHLGSADLSQ